MKPINAPYTLTQRFHFDAAHTLRRELEAEGSRRVHGHTYYCEISLSGDVDVATGMVVDLGFVRNTIGEIRQRLDHHFLDEVSGIGIPTLENLCRFVYGALAPTIPQITSVRIWRDAMGDGCTYQPDPPV